MIFLSVSLSYLEFSKILLLDFKVFDLQIPHKIQILFLLILWIDDINDISQPVFSRVLDFLFFHCNYTKHLHWGSHWCLKSYFHLKRIPIYLLILRWLVLFHDFRRISKIGENKNDNKHLFKAKFKPRIEVLDPWT